MSSFVAAVIVTLLAADIVWWWHADRLARRQPHRDAWRVLIALFVGGQMALVVWIIGGRVAASEAFARPPQALSAAAYLWHLLLLPAGLVLAAASGVLSRVWRAGRRLAAAGRAPSAATPPATEAPPVDPPSRRQFLVAVTAAAPALITGGGAAYSLKQVREFRVREIGVAVPGLPPDLDGLRVALVSDLHVGTFTCGRTVRRVVEQTSQLDADLVLLPGDLINNALADLSDALDAVCNMQSRHGAFLCVGNHDLIEDGAEFVRRVKARATLLVGESRVVLIRGHPVQLFGLPWSLDEAEAARSVGELAGQIVPGAFPILLAHHPHAFDAAAASGFALTVSGHTHGGQLMLGEEAGFGPLLYRYWSGLYRKPGRSGAALVVSNGVGNWFPVRTRAPAEIIHATLRPAAQATV